MAVKGINKLKYKAMNEIILNVESLKSGNIQEFSNDNDLLFITHKNNRFLIFFNGVCLSDYKTIFATLNKLKYFVEKYNLKAI